MEIKKTQNGSELTVALEGRLDTVTAPELEAALGGLEGVTKLTIDMEKLAYVSSAGLRVLLNAQKKMAKNGGSMVVRNANDELKEIFEITGFDEILTIEG
ncbi:MAG: STAS domain-containing protein [Synergistaceae bacterium]|nr:STAS domain-containing protein [Synergistaceae bacterium]